MSGAGGGLFSSRRPLFGWDKWSRNLSDATRYPLCWPAGRPRSTRRERARFKTTFGRARDELLEELRRLRARGIVLSTNCELNKQTELPRADRKSPSDPGVAVYFQHKGRDTCIACDKWDRVEDNLQAINHAINAIRGIARWGTGDMVDAAFSGFAQLPAAHAPEPHWTITLGVPAHAPTEQVVERWRIMARDHHPDRNDGDDTLAKRVNAAYEAFKRERGL